MKPKWRMRYQLHEHFYTRFNSRSVLQFVLVRSLAGQACQTRPHPRGSEFKEASDTRLTGVGWTQSTWLPHLALSSAPRFPLANPSAANLSVPLPRNTEDTGFSLAAWAKDRQAGREGKGQRVSLRLACYQLSSSTFFRLPTSQISSITPPVSSQSPGYMCAAAGLLLAGENHRLVRKGGGGGGEQGAPSSAHLQRHACAESAICFFSVRFVDGESRGIGRTTGKEEAHGAAQTML